MVYNGFLHVNVSNEIDIGRLVRRAHKVAYLHTLHLCKIIIRTQICDIYHFSLVALFKIHKQIKNAHEKHS
jgi:hypothetical protein